jgi:hypothetical protein
VVYIAPFSVYGREQFFAGTIGHRPEEFIVYNANIMGDITNTENGTTV